MDRNFAFLNSFSDISEDTFEALSEIAVFKRVKTGEQLVKLGEIPSKIYMLVQGVVRCYITTEDGKEFNKTFYLSTSLLGSLTALLTKKTSLFVFEALSDCKIYEIDYETLMTLCKKNSKVNRLYTKALEIVYVKYEKRLVELMSLDAKGRYLALKRQIPNVDNLIPQYQIASYLGITAVQLSRIRKKMDSN
ncbi:Crp/Fnr family transcriptional regulator [Seonamhaeicola sp. ML3]|uniref:Crp/Fnr family transcriptional regulator n=1 Tax=Seonamhaeicola sp. ML3 TaxID=2937786 RepID=UPI00201048F9|nr:Crp/Fnr family transcriptional regulator [Seonamhaeicola sp. ML3]